MKEQEQIVKLWAAAEAADESAVLATVVKTRGSSYRLPGARLLLTAGGKRAGSISGGCLEDDLVKKAWWMTENGPVIRQYDTTVDGETAPAFGLGCSGIIHLLLERLTPGNAAAMEAIARVREDRKPVLLSHVIGPADWVGRSVRDPEMAAAVEAEGRLALESGASRHFETGGVEVFLEVIAPPVRLLVFGGGDDARPVVDLAKYLGWRVAVYDGRSHYARRDRFPAADEVAVIGENDYGAIARDVDPWTVAALMTHSYNQDLSALSALSASPLRYLGILGPRRRTEQLLIDAGLTEHDLAPHVYSPMGLDIGADGPEQVALSVIGEMQAALNKRRGGLLRERKGSIHSPLNVESHASGWVRSIVCA